MKLSEEERKKRHSESDKKYRLSHPKPKKIRKKMSLEERKIKHLEASKRYRDKNKEKVKKSRENWLNKNREKYREILKNYYEKNPDKKRKWSKEHQKERKESLNNWIKNNRDRSNIIKHNYINKKRSASIGSDITIDWLINLKESTKNCPICGSKMNNLKNHPNQYNLDHIIPIKINGKHFKNNVRYICKICNLKRPKDGRDILMEKLYV